MSVMSGAPRVSIQEIDLSTRVPSFPGTFGAMALPSSRGPIEEPFLVTNDAQFLKKFTLNEKVEITHDLGYYSALAYLKKSNKLWVSRAIMTDYLYGGSTVFDQDGSAFTETVADTAINDTDDLITVANVYPTGTAVQVSTVGTLAGGLTAGTTYYVINDSDTTIQLASTYANATADTPTAIDLTSGASGDHIITVQSWARGEMDPTAHDFEMEPEGVFVLYGSDPGSWNDSVGYRIWLPRVSETVDTNTGITGNVLTVGNNEDSPWVSGEPIRVSLVSGDLPTGLEDNTTYYAIYVSDTEISLATTIPNAIAGIAITLTAASSGSMRLDPVVEVKEPNTFTLEVYLSGDENNPVESFTCSRVEGQKDGYGRNTYVETVLEGSEYIRAYDNVLIADTTLPGAVPIVTYLNGGDDGSAVSDGAMMLAADKFSNPENLPVTLLLDAGWATNAYQNHLISLAEGRKDCVAILSTPYSAENSSNYLTEIATYRRETLNANTSYAAMYSPHVEIYDKFNDRYIFVSPDGYAAAQISETASNYEIWYPVGGNKRGKINVLDVRRRFSAGEMDYLYNIGVNPIRFTPGKGIRIWGQKTLLSRPSALDRLNVRLLLIVIEPAIKEALEDFIFELNDDATRAIVTSVINTYMENIKARRGVYDFLTVCDDTNNTPADIDNYVLNVSLFVKPTKSIEYIPFKVVITSTGMAFSVAQEAV